MPARSTPGHQTAMEEQFTPAELAVLAELCDALAVPLHRWSEVPMIARPFEVLATVRLASWIAEAEGAGVVASQQEAARRLGLNFSTITTRIRDAA